MATKKEMIQTAEDELISRFKARVMTEMESVVTRVATEAKNEVHRISEAVKGLALPIDIVKVLAEGGAVGGSEFAVQPDYHSSSLDFSTYLNGNQFHIIIPLKKAETPTKYRMTVIVEKVK